MSPNQSSTPSVRSAEPPAEQPLSAPPRWVDRFNLPVMVPSTLIIVAVLVFSLAYSDTAQDAYTTLNRNITDSIGWWYVLVTGGFLIFGLWAAIGKTGLIRLGADGESPEFSFGSWIAMLFSAGIGVGLVFFGVAEPLTHYLSPPESLGVAGGTDSAANQAMGITMVHWGLQCWGIFALVGLGMAYMTYRRGRPMAIRWLLEPLLGKERVEGPLGHTADTIAVVGTTFGIATSVGIGATQLAAGLEYLGWIDLSNTLLVIAIAVITTVATFSVVSGVGKGLKWLSNINMLLAASLALFIALAGPTVFLLQAMVQNIGEYSSMQQALMFRTGPFTDGDWLGAWTIFYWGWIMSWAPFVGMFIARISRGRTVREFVLGVIAVPSVISLVWFTILGDSAILRQRDHGDMTNEAGGVTSNTGLFQLLDTLPFSVIASVVAFIVIVLFLITSADSGSLVVDTLASGGKPSLGHGARIYWTAVLGIVAAVLLVAGGAGSLAALQTAAVATAAPISILMTLSAWALWKALRFDAATQAQWVHMAETAPVAGRRTFATSMSGLYTLREVPRTALQTDPATGALTAPTPEDPCGDAEFEGDEVRDDLGSHTVGTGR